MSDEPGPSEPSTSSQSTSRTVRRRRPTAIAPEDAPIDVVRDDEIRILRPSDVPQREPLPEYNPPNSNRTIVPANVPIDRLHEYFTDNVLNVTIPSNIPSEILIQEAMRVGGPVSFRSTNYVDPEAEQLNRSVEAMEVSEAEQIPQRTPEWLVQNAFIERNTFYFENKFLGCTTMKKKDDVSQVNVAMEAPKDSIYVGGTYFFYIVLTVRNQKIFPEIHFRTLLFNPNLSASGIYDTEGLMRNWSGNSDLGVIYSWLRNEIRNLRADIFRRTPAQLENMSQPNLSKLARENWEKFEEMARDMVNKMAGGTVWKHKTVKANMGNVYDPKRGWAAPEPEEVDSDAEIDVEN
ncbi:CBN-UEV-3 protein [Caenorhabditis brenneri]|uniref:CBN-UEV-3 protein n=1 Tax=Caenorhabditis brenneri TaxID=135651 RepID=G0MLW5_CAEBE|nr:CBN-UEV-3 protein [Caenorhabditis brenneri]